MDLAAFKNSLAADSPPAECSPLLTALWWDAKDDWDRAHGIAQDIASPQGSLVHAYLHRKEGDRSSAGYWYSRAGEDPPRGDLHSEWEDLVRKFLGE